MAMLSPNLAHLFDANVSKRFYYYLGVHAQEFVQWVEKTNSRRQYEEVALFGELPMPGKVNEYAVTPETEAQAGPKRRATHEKFGFTLIASEEVVEDELENYILTLAGKCGLAMRHRYETEGSEDLVDAFSVSTVGNADTADETLCATSHATFSGAGGSSQSNRPATDITLGPDSLWSGIDNFATLEDHEGNPVLVIPNKLIIAPQNERVAIECLESTQMPYKTTREVNALLRRKNKLSYVVSHYMVSQDSSMSTAWFLVSDKRPIMFYERRGPTVKPDSTPRSDSRSWTITARLSHLPYDWYQIYGTDGAA